MNAKRTLYCLSLLMSGWVFANPTPQAAQAEAEVEKLFALSLEELFDLTVEVATKSEKNLADSPSTVSVFSAAEIDALGIDNLQQLLNLVPGFQSYFDGFLGETKAVSSRGRRASTSSFELLVLYDGQRLQEDRSGSAMDLNPALSLANIARVEIIRGPGSAIYGSNAFTGIINLVTKTGENNVSIGVGEGDLYRAAINYSTPLAQGQWSVFLQGFDQHGQNQNLLLSDLPAVSHNSNSGFDFYTKYSSDSSNINIRYSRRDVEGFYTLERIDDEFNQGQRGQFHFAADHRWTLNDTLGLKARAFYIQHQVDLDVTLESAGTLAFISNPPSNEPLYTRVELEGHETGIELEFDWQISANSEALFGIVHRRPETDDGLVGNNFDLAMLLNNQFPVNYYGELKKTAVVQIGQKRFVNSVFMQYDGQLTAQLMFTTGIRYDDYSDFGSTLNPRLGLVYKVNDVHRLKFSYGQAFRAPTPTQTRLANNPITVGNRDIQPEKMKTFELHWSGAYQYFNVGLTLFDNKIEDAVAQLPTADGTKVQWDNGPTWENSGAELELFAELTDALYVRAAYSKLFDQPADSVRQSDNLLSASINYRHGLWNFNLNGYYHSEMTYLHSTTLQQVNLGGFAVFNSKLSYDYSAQTKLYLKVSNLFDKGYLTPSATGVLSNGVVNEGQLWSLGLDFQF